MVQLLLKSGADKDLKDNESRTPLYTAAIFGEVAAARALWLVVRMSAFDATSLRAP